MTQSAPVNLDDSASTQPLDGRLPLVISPAAAGVSLVQWGTAQREVLQDWLCRWGALLFRGFDLATPEQFHAVVNAIGGAPLDYHERSSPRSEIIPGIYTSTDYPANQSIFPHNECSYTTTYPMKLFFFCETPPASGGETPIADTRRILARLSPATRAKFERKGWMLVRNFHGGKGAGYSWQSAFQTDDPKALERYCQEQDILLEWRPKNALRARHIHAAIEPHPKSGELTWFNHAAFFHYSTFEPSMREALILAYGRENLPNDTFYGDGSEIEPDVMNEIRAAYRAELVSFAWQKGDLLMIDNMLASHSRAPYQPPRKILVAMTEPYRRRRAQVECKASVS
jgi:alpha-ketoglutarate-dependent taurine dioxygenase